MPSQQNVWCGMRFVSFHDGLLREEPPGARRRGDLRQRGGVAERVGQPDLERLDAELLARRSACRRRTAGPAPRRRACWCRTRPTCRRPARTGPRRPARGSARTARGSAPSSRRTAAPTSRRRRSRGPRPSASSTLENVRAHLRTVSRTGHSQAESMCAWPTATMRCALGVSAGGRAPARGRRGPPPPCPATSSGSTRVDHVLERAQDLRPPRRGRRRARRRGRSRAARSWCSSHTVDVEQADVDARASR